MSDVTPRPAAGGVSPIVNADTNELLMKGATDTDIVGSGAIYNPTEDRYEFPSSIQTPPTSVLVGENITLSENGGFLENETTTLLKKYLMLDYENNPNTGTKVPIYFEREAKQNDVIIQSDDSTPMLNIASIDFGVPLYDRQNQAVSFNFINAVTNFAIEVVVNTRVVGHYPSLQAWQGTKPGYNLGTGIQKINLDPFFSNLIDYSVSFNLKADQNIDVLGDGTVPWYSLDLNVINRKNIALEENVIVKPNGGGYFVSQVNTEIILSSTYYKVDAVFTPWSLQKDFIWDGTNKRFVYTGSGATTSLAFDFSAAADTNNTRLNYVICVNGVDFVGSQAETDFINNNKEQRMGINVQFTFATNDYIELCVKADSGGVYAYTSHCQLSIR